MAHAKERRWNFPCSSINSAFIKICVWNLELILGIVLHSQRHYTFSVRLLQLLLIIQARVDDEP